MDQKQIQSHIQTIRDPRKFWQDRRDAITALKDNAGEPEVKAALLHVLQNDEDWFVRKRAAKALKPHVESGACNGESTPVKAVFVYVLRNDKDKDVLKGVADGLQRCPDEPAVQAAFCAILNDHDNPPELLYIVANGLKRCPDKPAVQAAFRGVLEDQEWLNKDKVGEDLRRASAVCATAVAVLANRGWEVEAIPGLLCHTLQTHPYSRVRIATARALTPRVRDNPTVKAVFCDVLQNDKSPPKVYRVAYKALEPYRDEPTVQAICFAAMDHMTAALVENDRSLRRALEM
jgi:hypothetical protein